MVPARRPPLPFPALCAGLLALAACSPQVPTFDAGRPPPDAGPQRDAGEVDEPDGLWVWENPLPDGNSFYGVGGTGRDDVWAVGDQGTTLHWDGRRWKRFRAPPPLLFDKTGDLFKVIAVAKDDVWAVGGTRAIHWDGTGWATRFSLGGLVYDVWPDGDGVLLFTSYGKIFRSDAAGWKVVATIPGGLLFRCVWGSGRDDIWVGALVQTSIPAPVLLHWDGQSWTPRLEHPYDWYESVSGMARDDVWLANGPRLAHWDGRAWSFETNTGWPKFNDVWARASNDAFAVGNGGIVVRWNGQRWSRPRTIAAGRLQSVWGSAADDVWAVGERGAFVHWDGTDWRGGDSPTPQLRAIWGSTTDDIWAVGEGGAALHRLAGKWSVVATPTGQRLNALSGTGPDDVWAVGANGTALHWNGSAWSSVPGLSGELRTVLSLGREDVWVVGADCHPSRWNGTAWSPVPTGTATICDLRGTGVGDLFGISPNTVSRWTGGSWTTENRGTFNRSIWGMGPSDFWVVGEMELLHWDGSGWARFEVELGADLQHVWGSAADDVWALGAVTYHWDGFAWSKVNTGFGNTLIGVWGATAQDVRLVGEHGAILRRP